MCDILRLSGTDLAHYNFTSWQVYLIVNPRVAYRSPPVLTGERWLAILTEEPGNVGLLLKEGNLSYGD
jgi:hypothetical protein